MSYINVSVTHRHAPGALAPAGASETLRIGFNREGGRLDSLERATSSHGPLPPRTQRLLPDAELATAAEGVLRAVQGANWVQDVLVDHGDGGQPALVSWTHRHGATGTGLAGSLPSGVQAVLDATAALDAVVEDKLTVRILPA